MCAGVLAPEMSSKEESDNDEEGDSIGIESTSTSTLAAAVAEDEGTAAGESGDGAASDGAVGACESNEEGGASAGGIIVA